MVELFVYDAGEIRRMENGRTKSFPIERHPVYAGFREGLKVINPPLPFLVRGLFGDFDFEYDFYDPSFVKNTFDEQELGLLVKKVLLNGHDKNIPDREKYRHPYEKELTKELNLNYDSFIWAAEYKSIGKGEPYRYYDDTGCDPQGYVNDFSMVFDPNFYTPTDNSRILFYQPDIEKRRQALLGIIVSDVNPNKPRRLSDNSQHLNTSCRL